MMARTMWIVAALAVTACSGGATEGSDAGATDANASSATGDAGAADAGTTDSGTTDSGTTDSGTTDSGTLDSGTTDSGSLDAGIDFLRVVCRGDADCAAGQTCQMNVPGGRCTCGSAADCGGEICMGVCFVSCSATDPCNLGMRCAAFAGSEYCGTIACGSCPAPYVCGATSCERPRCDAAGSCPAPLICGTGDYCVEP